MKINYPISDYSMSYSLQFSLFISKDKTCKGHNWIHDSVYTLELTWCVHMQVICVSNDRAMKNLSVSVIDVQDVNFG